MSVIRFTVFGAALPKGSMKAFMPKGAKFPVVTSATKGLKQWEQSIRAAAQTVATGQLMAGALALKVTFYFTRPVYCGATQKCEHDA